MRRSQGIAVLASLDSPASSARRRPHARETVTPAMPRRHLLSRRCSLLTGRAPGRYVLSSPIVLGRQGQLILWCFDKRAAMTRSKWFVILVGICSLAAGFG